ncbi:MAG: alpha/beta hydrolase [Geodermatophilaceae bacterium]|nr:alpha/beta hydrolase [Geodermatophilaceae bacterium]
MATVTVDGVQTWYEERGHGDPLVLLHPGGAGVDARAFGPNLDALAQHFHVFTPERRAHGRTPDVEGPITYELMAQDTIAFLDTVIGQPVHLLGYSDGAVVALLVALSRPDLVSRLVLAAGIFHHEGWHEGVLDGEPPAFLRDSYGQISPDGIGHYDVVAAKLAATHADEPALDASELQELTTRTLVMVADDDEVRLEHAVEMYRGLPDAELAVVPGTSHGLLMEKPDMCHQLITDFLSQDPVATLAPIRRASPAVKP